MRAIVGFTIPIYFVVIGCGDSGRPAPVAANPYDNTARPLQDASPAPPAPPAPGRPANRANPARSAPAAPARRRTGQASAPRRRTRPAALPTVRDDGEHAVTLTLPEYSRLARRAIELLTELTEIHIAVDESGDGGPYQERWGELTADLTRLHRQVLESGYPPADIADHLKKSWLPRLDDAMTEAGQAIEEHTSVESGFNICYAEAKEINAHLKRTRGEPSSE